MFFKQNYIIKEMPKLSPKKYRIQQKQQTKNTKTLANEKHKELETLTREILKQGKYMYIDINQQEGYQLMKECESSDDEEQIQKISNKFLINLNDFTSPNYKNVNYMYKVQQESRRKKRALNIIRDELQRSFQKKQEWNKPDPNSTRYVFLRKRDKSIKKPKQQLSTQQTLNQLSKKMNSRLYHSYHKSLESSFNYSTLQTERSFLQNKKQNEESIGSQKRLRMLLPRIAREKKKVVL